MKFVETGTLSLASLLQHCVTRAIDAQLGKERLTTLSYVLASGASTRMRVHCGTQFFVVSRINFA